ncbi:hypothetical protein G5I_14409 [Acromyrmex echinatior]|uniref:Uncharacterized protein n=1 Tax=Acromyrmex echinatior TaxID=103372 RepID=F4X7M5_ACREC|nr:hypothetical protein G5I_14409 [Acromyrmex echinatior]
MAFVRVFVNASRLLSELKFLGRHVKGKISATSLRNCSVTCGTGIRTRTIECRDGVGAISRDCDLAERPHTEQACKTNVACPTYGDGMSQPLMQPYPLSPMSEKLMDQPIPSESTRMTTEIYDLEYQDVGWSRHQMVTSG